VPAAIAARLIQIGIATVSFSLMENSIGPSFAWCVSLV
jgi:hypothetical protein